nr:MAG TPA: hypothetical protein [Bacteriophage sp.]
MLINLYSSFQQIYCSTMQLSCQCVMQLFFIFYVLSIALCNNIIYNTIKRRRTNYGQH